MADGNAPAPARTIEAPAWMETFDSIHAEAKLYPEARYCALVDRTGGAVTGAVEGTWIEDRSTGVVFLRRDSSHSAGDIIKLNCYTRSEGGTITATTIHFRVLRPVTMDEVRALAAKWGGAKPLPVRDGNWYLVMTD